MVIGAYLKAGRMLLRWPACLWYIRQTMRLDSTVVVVTAFPSVGIIVYPVSRTQ